MHFDSYIYPFAFLPLVCVLYLFLRRHNAVILVASYAFYGWYNIYILIPLILSSLWDFRLGSLLHKETSARKRKSYLFLSLALNLGLLATLKYGTWVLVELNFFFSSVGMGTPLPEFEFPLPPGISFYTFQTLSYTIDIYRRRFTPHKSIIDYLTFVSFFPQLIAGPIERASHLLPQIAAATKKRLDSAMCSHGIFLIGFGLFKKIVIADNMGLIVDAVKVSTPGGGFLFCYAFAFQIYCDFSAYTDIARGSAKFFGIELSRNFLTPYFAPNPSDFWRRWHISLSTWLRDYLYVSLGGSQSGVSRTLRNLVITMALGGLWHGTGWLFLIWGLFHGLLLVLYRVAPIDVWLVRYLGRAGNVISVILMFNLVCIGWGFFRADSLPHFVQLWHSAWALFSNPLDPDFLELAKYFALFAIPAIALDAIGYMKRCEFVDLFPVMPFFVRVLSYVCLFYAIVLLGVRQGSEFIYFQF